MSALSYKVKENGLIIVEDFAFQTPKTKQYIEMLSNFKLDDKKTLLVVADPDQNLLLSARNLGKAKISRADSLNTYDILNASNVLISENSIKVIQDNLGKTE